MKIKSFLLLIPILLTSCEKKDELFPNANQQILFQVDYVNYAWGYSHNGIVIDSSGNVRYFKFPQKWHYSDTASYLTESDMNENFQQLDTVFITLDKNTVLKYFGMLKNVSEGQLSKPYNRMFDAGETTYSGYIFNSNAKIYKHVLVKKHGDWSIDNNSAEAEDIFNWLMQTYIDVMKKIHQSR